MSQKILLVDDEPLNLDLLEQELGELGYAIAKADGGRAALDMLATVSPDLILLDYQMPGMNGFEVLTEIKKKQAELPVIMITAYGTIERAVEAIKSGADDFVTKPFDPDHLALVVKKALEQARLRSEVDLLTRSLPAGGGKEYGDGASDRRGKESRQQQDHCAPSRRER
jgi:DNA-binding NtrC family response regulator